MTPKRRAVLNLSWFFLCICCSKSLLIKDFTFGPLNSHRYIGNIVISKIVISGFRPIHFT